MVKFQTEKKHTSESHNRNPNFKFGLIRIQITIINYYNLYKRYYNLIYCDLHNEMLASLKHERSQISLASSTKHIKNESIILTISRTVSLNRIQQNQRSLSKTSPITHKRRFAFLQTTRQSNEKPEDHGSRRDFGTTVTRQFRPVFPQLFRTCSCFPNATAAGFVGCHHRSAH